MASQTLAEDRTSPSPAICHSESNWDVTSISSSIEYGSSESDFAEFLVPDGIRDRHHDRLHQTTSEEHADCETQIENHLTLIRELMCDQDKMHDEIHSRFSELKAKFDRLNSRQAQQQRNSLRVRDALVRLSAKVNTLMGTCREQRERVEVDVVSPVKFHNLAESVSQITHRLQKVEVSLGHKLREKVDQANRESMEMPESIIGHMEERLQVLCVAVDYLYWRMGSKASNESAAKVEVTADGSGKQPPTKKVTFTSKDDARSSSGEEIQPQGPSANLEDLIYSLEQSRTGLIAFADYQVAHNCGNINVNLNCQYSCGHGRTTQSNTIAVPVGQLFERSGPINCYYPVRERPQVHTHTTEEGLMAAVEPEHGNTEPFARQFEQVNEHIEFLKEIEEIGMEEELAESPSEKVPVMLDAEKWLPKEDGVQEGNVDLYTKCTLAQDQDTNQKGWSPDTSETQAQTKGNYAGGVHSPKPPFSTSCQNNTPSKINKSSGVSMTYTFSSPASGYLNYGKETADPTQTTIHYPPSQLRTQIPQQGIDEDPEDAGWSASEP